MNTATTTTLPPPEPALADLLALQQMFSPAFPVGGFAWSQGLEAAIAAGTVRDAAGLADWVAAVLGRGAGRADATLLAHARRPGADAGALDALARALAPSAERLAETVETGRAFAAAAAAVTGQALPPLALPVVAGLATAGLRVGTPLVLGFWLHALAAQLVSAAVRFVPLGQTEGQRVLAGLAPLIARVAAEAAEAPLDAIATFTPGADLAGMEHETLEVRIFRS